MRAVIVREHGPLARHRLESVPDPAPARGEVLIEARAIGVNFPDLMVMQGSYQLLPPRPFSPGKEVAGVVGAVGEGVTRVRAGERVMALPEYGTYAEKVVVSEKICYPMPQAMPFDDGAVLALAYQTAHFALLERGAYRNGESVLVTGASGGVGLACVQLAKALGAVVVAGVTSQEKGALCRRHGADHVVDLAAPDLRDGLRAQVHAAVGMGGVDIVLDNVGGDVFDAALRALAWRGRLVSIGFASGRVPEVKAGYLLVKNLAVIGLQWTDYRGREPERVQRVQEGLYALYGEGKLKPEITARYALEDFAEALARFDARQVQGKIVLLPG
ncbi:MAG: NADPH:quinone oxidoreductase family protein [Betaproteobacteria bacterium]|nr:NADPH:quinone oxidoreductase family protein [Betaproteobacteria bacterium]MDH4324332.1 NADPH:quinone oxidoreductase family protein [Betaproteobacteria bacterium]